MRAGRPRSFEFTLPESERMQLTALVQSRALPHGLVRRAQIILWSADGESNSAIAERLGVSVPLVGHWRKRSVREPMERLGAEPLFVLHDTDPFLSARFAGSVTRVV